MRETETPFGRPNPDQGGLPEPRALTAALGFTDIGLPRRVGQLRSGPLAGQWRDMLLIERRSDVAGVRKSLAAKGLSRQIHKSASLGSAGWIHQGQNALQVIQRGELDRDPALALTKRDLAPGLEPTRQTVRDL
jgi:hypothetical protein